jgi:hypothetical protein
MSQIMEIELEIKQPVLHICVTQKDVISTREERDIPLNRGIFLVFVTYVKTQQNYKRIKKEFFCQN